MRYRVEEPLFTRVLPDVRALRPAAGSVYITGDSVEQRSTHYSEWQASCPDVTFMHVTTVNRSTITTAVGDATASVSLRSATALRELFDGGSRTAIYLDITGLPHHVWAPLLRTIRSRPEPSFVVYVEPGDYRFSASPTDVTLFDLSEKIDGIAPLPGYVSLTSRAGQESLFVPLLGFEGARLAFMLEAVQPKRENIAPIIGVPGFRPEYPFYTYLGNRLQLSETRSWHNVRFAPANCPFSAYHVIGAIASESPSRHLRLGLIGTKPHALGAILYFLDHPTETELLYDHPIRKALRTEGISRVCVYDLSLLPPLRPDRVTMTRDSQ
jgi:hypothetical protein